MKHKTHNKKGFTIVELLVTVAIIALLASMVVISVQHSKAKARDAQRVSDLNSLVTALALYNNSFGAYPVAAPPGYDIINREDPGAELYDRLVTDTGLLGGLPVDPVNTGNYIYNYESDGSDYILEYYLETDTILGRDPGSNYIVP